jgi:hypothetical protein
MAGLLDLGCNLVSVSAFNDSIRDQEKLHKKKKNYLGALLPLVSGYIRHQILA